MYASPREASLWSVSIWVRFLWGFVKVYGGMVVVCVVCWVYVLCVLATVLGPSIWSQI